MVGVEVVAPERKSVSPAEDGVTKASGTKNLQWRMGMRHGISSWRADL